MTTNTRTRRILHDIDEICSRIANGESLRSVAADHLTDHASMIQWIHRDETRLAQYDRARINRAHKLFDEIIDLADSAAGDPTEVAARRLQVDTRKWAAGKLYPKYYGDKLQTEFSGTVSFASALAELAAKPVPAGE